MYKYININSKYIKELQEFNPEMVVEIAAMFPDEYSKYVSMVEEGIAAADVEIILRGVHSLKSNIKIFIDEQHEIIQKMQQIEAALRKRLEAQETSQPVDNSLDYHQILHQLRDMLQEPMAEIAHFAAHSES
jgi:spore cortex formation protein SpoVR/YcgB (stage V sporulation)